MATDRRQSRLRLTLFGFHVALGTSLLVGVVGFGDSWERAAVISIGNGTALAVGIYLFHAMYGESSTTE